jgi:hypothetical protein
LESVLGATPRGFESPILRQMNALSPVRGAISHHAVNDRPVVLVPTADGGMDALTLDWSAGDLVPDRSMFSRVTDVGIGKDVDRLTEHELAVLWARHRCEIAIRWEHTGDGEVPYRHGFWTVRVNDFPAEPLYTALLDGQDVLDLEDWPARWVRPDVPEHLLSGGSATDPGTGAADG